MLPPLAPDWRDRQTKGIGRRFWNRRLVDGRLVVSTQYEGEVDVWTAYQRECERIKDRLRAQGFVGEDIWELAEAAVVAFERMNELHAAGKITIIP